MAGEAETRKMRNGIMISGVLERLNWQWEMETLWGGMPGNLRYEVLHRQQQQEFDGSTGAFLLILTPQSFEDGLTRKINGMISCCDQSVIDDLGFFHKCRGDVISTIHCNGSAGRVTHSLVLDLVEPMESKKMLHISYDAKLQMGLGAIALNFDVELPGMTDLQKTELETDLVKLGLITEARVLTVIGQKCVEGDMDIRKALLVEVGIRLGIEVHAKIAAAYIVSGVELFSYPHLDATKLCGLTDQQLACPQEYGDIHTAVHWYWYGFRRMTI